MIKQPHIIYALFPLPDTDPGPNPDLDIVPIMGKVVMGSESG